MKHLAIILLAFIGLLSPPVIAQADTRDTRVNTIKWKNLDLAPLSGERGQNIQLIIANANKFALNKWYHDIKKFDTQDEYIDFGGRAEKFIRPATHQAFCLAIALKWGIYNPDITGVPPEEAKARTIRMTKSLCYRHKANTPKGWGDEWQSALWASQAALAAWFMWDELDETTRQLALNMLIHEANRFNDYKVPYYKDREGKILFKGDSKSEENAWNSTILVAACVMLPDHRNWKTWNKKAIELQVSAYSLPDDWKKNKIVNGFPFKKLEGSNIEENGTVINHNIIHPDYMAAIMGSATNGWIYRLGGMKIPEASLVNGDVVYYAFTDLKFKDGKTIYVRNESNGASSNMYFPEGNDWGLKRQANYWLMDVMAEIYGWDQQSSIKAKDWAVTREAKMLEMQNRDTTGQFYQSPKENSFASREEMIPYHLGFGYLGLWEQRNNMIQITDKPLSPP